MINLPIKAPEMNRSCDVELYYILYVPFIYYYWKTEFDRDSAKYQVLLHVIWGCEDIKLGRQLAVRVISVVLVLE